jgi:hypothetical protein
LAKDKVMAIDRISQRYGVLPSVILKSTLEDLQFDILVAGTAIEEEIKAAKKSQAKKGRHGR